jgi:hypothetical protein
LMKLLVLSLADLLRTASMECFTRKAPFHRDRLKMLGPRREGITHVAVEH